MFDRLTAPARQVVVLAQEEARMLRHDYVGSEHLLVGLMVASDCVAAQALRSLGITLESVRSWIVQRLGRGDHDSPSTIPFNPRSKRLLALAAEEALRREADYVGTADILLAIADETEAVSARILRSLGLDLGRIAQALADMPSATEAETAGRPAGTDSTAQMGGLRAISRQLEPEIFESAADLARAFGLPVIEPTWWPRDTGEISRYLFRSAGGAIHYQVGATRGNAAPICVVGHHEAALAGRTPRDWLTGEWSEPPELADLRGLIGKVGTPRRLRAAIYDQGVQLQLVGYDTEEEILRAVDSLRSATPD